MTYCDQHGHFEVLNMRLCMVCKEPLNTDAQMAFEDVVEMEPVSGDPEYTAWVAAGRPKVT